MPDWDANTTGDPDVDINPEAAGDLDVDINPVYVTSTDAHEPPAALAAGVGVEMTELPLTLDSDNENPMYMSDENKFY